MRHLLALVSLSLISLATLYGCAAPVIVGGAAAGAVVVNERRSAGSVLDDEAIELKIQELIYTDESLKHKVHVNVNCFNGFVLLSGEVPTQEMRAKVVRYAQSVGKVRRIYNETVIGPQSEFKARRHDVFITTKVKAALLANKKVSGLSIHVTTEAQTVYLMGLVTEKEGNLAADVVRHVQGVKQVVKLFEYQQSATQ
jgi:osmotically-inducible protein OsmY